MKEKKEKLTTGPKEPVLGLSYISYVCIFYLFVYYLHLHELQSVHMSINHLTRNCQNEHLHCDIHHDMIATGIHHSPSPSTRVTWLQLTTWRLERHAEPIGVIGYKGHVLGPFVCFYLFCFFFITNYFLDITTQQQQQQQQQHIQQQQHYAMTTTPWQHRQQWQCCTTMVQHIQWHVQHTTAWMTVGIRPVLKKISSCRIGDQTGSITIGPGPKVWLHSVLSQFSPWSFLVLRTGPLSTRF